MRHLFWIVPALVLVPASSAWGTEFTVTMGGMAYQPASISARIGDTVRFVNDDVTDHNVFVPTAGHAVDLGKQEPGGEAFLILGKAGTFDIECVFHADMLTVVEVK